LVVGVLCILFWFNAPIYHYLTWIWLLIFGLLIWSTLKRLTYAVR
jgi:hypothetical protein